MTNKMNFSYFIPSSWNAIWKGNHLLTKSSIFLRIPQLSQKSRLIVFLGFMFFIVVLMTIDSSHKRWTKICLLNSILYSNIFNPYQLLIKFASSVMNACHGRDYCNINIVILLNRRLQCMQKIFS